MLSLHGIVVCIDVRIVSNCLCMVKLFGIADFMFMYVIER